jgi:hypothetical protein
MSFFLLLQWAQAKVLAAVPREQRVGLLKAQGSGAGRQYDFTDSTCWHRPHGNNCN